MSRRDTLEKDFLIEQIFADIREANGENLNEGLGDWLAGKKARYGAKLRNAGTAMKNAGRATLNAGSNLVGRAANAGSNVAGAVQNAIDNRAFKQDAKRDQARAARLLRRGDTAGAEAAHASAAQSLAHSKNKFQGQKYTPTKFQAQEYEDADAAEKRGVLSSLEKKIKGLIQEFETKGGNFNDLLANLGINTAGGFNESYNPHKNTKRQLKMLDSIK